jgi:hypothetical protein
LEQDLITDYPYCTVSSSFDNQTTKRFFIHNLVASVFLSQMSSWFGGSSNKESSSSPKDFTSGDESTFSSSPNMMMNSSGGGGGGALAELQQFQLMIQQSLLVQEIIGDLTAMSFEKCITGKPDSHLSGKEVACTHAVVGKWLDTNEYMNGRLAKKQQQSSSSSGY